MSMSETQSKLQESELHQTSEERTVKLYIKA